MADESELHNLELRIAKLEDLLRQERAARQTPEVSDDELRAFFKIHQALLRMYPGKHCAVVPCAMVEVNIHCCSDDVGRSYGRFLGLTGDQPGQETPSEPA